jgi:glutaredoxin-like protein NrdH
MITVYTKPGCGSCDATKIWLTRNKIDYLSVDIDTNHSARELVEKLGYTQLPVIVCGTEHWSGFRIDKLAGLKARR